MDQNDHDLLIRIAEQVSQIQKNQENERVASIAREAKSEIAAREYRDKIDNEIKILDNEVESLRTSRAQFYAVAATISFLVGVLIKVFWK